MPTIYESKWLTDFKLELLKAALLEGDTQKEDIEEILKFKPPSREQKVDRIAKEVRLPKWVIKLVGGNR